jgi:hypothetical protein
MVDAKSRKVGLLGTAFQQDTRSYRGEKIMIVKDPSNSSRNGIICQRCSGRMGFQKFYGEDNVFWGWHCITCGEILDPVILLHRLSQDASIPIPENEEEIMSLVKKYMTSSQKNNMNRNPS